MYADRSSGHWSSVAFDAHRWLGTGSPFLPGWMSPPIWITARGAGRVISKLDPNCKSSTHLPSHINRSVHPHSSITGFLRYLVLPPRRTSLPIRWHKLQAERSAWNVIDILWWISYLAIWKKSCAITIHNRTADEDPLSQPAKLARLLAENRSLSILISSAKIRSYRSALADTNYTYLIDRYLTSKMSVLMNLTYNDQ